jgi:hypothetical protein
LRVFAKGKSRVSLKPAAHWWRGDKRRHFQLRHRLRSCLCTESPSGDVACDCRPGSSPNRR